MIESLHAKVTRLRAECNLAEGAHSLESLSSEFNDFSRRLVAEVTCDLELVTCGWCVGRGKANFHGVYTTCPKCNDGVVYKLKDSL